MDGKRDFNIAIDGFANQGRSVAFRTRMPLRLNEFVTISIPFGGMMESINVRLLEERLDDDIYRYDGDLDEPAPAPLPDRIYRPELILMKAVVLDQRRLRIHSDRYLDPNNEVRARLQRDTPDIQFIKGIVLQETHPEAGWKYAFAVEPYQRLHEKPAFSTVGAYLVEQPRPRV